MSGIYASLRQAQIIILEILNVWMPVPLYLSGVVIIFAFLDLGKNISLSANPLVEGIFPIHPGLTENYPFNKPTCSFVIQNSLKLTICEIGIIIF
jgi:hypothetical protein